MTAMSAPPGIPRGYPSARISPSLAARKAAQLGAAIRRVRRLQGLTQAELAERAGIGRCAMVRIERGQQMPRLTTMIAVLGAMGLQARIEPLTFGTSDSEEIRRLLTKSDLST